MMDRFASARGRARTLAVAAGLGLAALASLPTPAGAEEMVVGLITKTDTIPFFVKMREAAQAEAGKLGVKLVASTGKFDGDTESQVANTVPRVREIRPTTAVPDELRSRPMMIQGRSNFVYRAKEQFFEEYLLIKVLKPFLSEAGPLVIAERDFQEEFTYDFAFETNDLAIEVTSYRQEEKIEHVRNTAQRDGKRLMVLYTEELTDYINQPEVIAGRIRAALASREAFIGAMGFHP